MFFMVGLMKTGQSWGSMAGQRERDLTVVTWEAWDGLARPVCSDYSLCLCVFRDKNVSFLWL